MSEYSINANLDDLMLSSNTKITLQVGPNSIVIEPSGITINCVNLTLQAETEMQVKALMLNEQISGVKDSTIAMYKQA